MAENVVLSGTGFLVNLFQWGAVKKLNLTLYPTHLVIENSKKGNIIADIPIRDIKDLKNKTSDGQMVIVTDKKKYKISWKNIDAEKIALGAVVGDAVNAARGNQSTNDWIEAINKLKA